MSFSNPPMRFLAIDLGDKRTGLAVADSITRIVSPLGVIEVPVTERDGQALIDAINKAIADQFSPHAAAALVVGLPLNMDGTEGPRAKQVRAFIARLEAALSPRRPIHFQDERLTSAAADWQMARSGKTHKEKKQLRDALAAAELLRDFLDALNGRSSAPSSEAT